MSSTDGYTFDAEFARVLRNESWPLYAVGALTLALRVFTKLTYLKRFNTDDYVQVLAFGLYTGLLVTLNYIADSGGSNLYDAGEEVYFTAEVIRVREYNSKIVVVSEQFMLCTIYTLKVSVILFYLRLTQGLSRHQMILYVAGAVAIGFVATQITFFTACRPFSGYWAIPPPSEECTVLRIYGIVQGVFNIGTDLFMLAVTIPMIYRLKVPGKQRVLLVALFSLGVVVLLMAVLAKAYNNSNYYSSGYMLWYIREASTATYVSNLPHIWPLLRQLFPWLRGTTRPTYSQGAYGRNTSAAVGTHRSRANPTDDAVLLGKMDVEAMGDNKIMATVEVRQDVEMADMAPAEWDKEAEPKPGL